MISLQRWRIAVVLAGIALLSLVSLQWSLFDQHLKKSPVCEAPMARENIEEVDDPVYVTWHRQHLNNKLHSGATILGTDFFIDDAATSILDENPKILDPLNLGNKYPKFSRPGAFVFLVSEGIFVDYLIIAINDLHTNFYALDPENRLQYDIVIVYFPELTLEDKLRVMKAAVPVTLRWQPIPKPEIPFKLLLDVFGDHSSYHTTCFDRHWPRNYLLMGMFRAYTQFLLPMLAQYEYIWTLDADLYIKSPVFCDLFGVMKRDRLALGHYDFGLESGKCPMIGLSQEIMSWARMNNISTVYAERVPVQASFGGAFILHDMRFFTSDVYLSLAAFFIKTGGLWKHRWAEQNLWPYVVPLLAPGKSRQFGGLKLAHKDPTSWLWTEREMCSDNCAVLN